MPRKKSTENKLAIPQKTSSFKLAFRALKKGGDKLDRAVGRGIKNFTDKRLTGKTATESATVKTLEKQLEKKGMRKEFVQMVEPFVLDTVTEILSESVVVEDFLNTFKDQLEQGSLNDFLDDLVQKKIENSLGDMGKNEEIEKLRKQIEHLQQENSEYIESVRDEMKHLKESVASVTKLMNEKKDSQDYDSFKAEVISEVNSVVNQASSNGGINAAYMGESFDLNEHRAQTAALRKKQKKDVEYVQSNKAVLQALTELQMKKKQNSFNRVDAIKHLGKADKDVTALLNELVDANLLYETNEKQSTSIQDKSLVF